MDAANLFHQCQSNLNTIARSATSAYRTMQVHGEAQVNLLRRVSFVVAKSTACLAAGNVVLELANKYYDNSLIKTLVYYPGSEIMPLISLASTAFCFLSTVIQFQASEIRNPLPQGEDRNFIRSVIAFGQKAASVILVGAISSGMFSYKLVKDFHDNSIGFESLFPWTVYTVSSVFFGLSAAILFQASVLRNQPIEVNPPLPHLEQ